MNRNRLCIAVCSSFVSEVHQVIAQSRFDDVIVRAFSGNCADCKGCKRRVEDFVTVNAHRFHKVLIYTGNCVQGFESVPRNVKIVRMEVCFDLIIQRAVFEHFVQKGYYLINSGKLRRVEQMIVEWGFPADAAKSFFSEASRALLHIVTVAHDDSDKQIERLSEYTGLPAENLQVGLDYCRLLIESEILIWRDEKAQTELFDRLAKATAKTANFAMVFQQINHLVQTSDEEHLVVRIFELLNLLFSPQNMTYHPIVGDTVGKPIAFVGDSSMELLSQNAEFCIELKLNQESFGKFELYGLAFPQHIDQYRDSATLISNVCALAIANARKFTELKETSRISQEYSDKLKKTNAEKDKFFSIIAHDLRSPFTGFLLFSQMLAEQTEDLTKEEIRDYGKNLFDSANNLFSLLENLLQWARMKRGVTPFRLERVELLTVVDQCVELNADAALKKKIVIENQVPEDVFVRIDVNMISSVIRNLLTNAIKFTKHQGRVSVECNPEFESGFCSVSVKDSGIGMSEELLGRLFKLDERVSREGTDGEPSTGLGLLLCREFAEKHGGRIWAESEVGSGSCFIFTLPLADHND